MDFLSVPLIAVFSLITALIFGVAAQRLLGMRLGLVRLLAAGAFAMVINPPFALVGDYYAEREPTGSAAVTAF